jgi:phosphoadenosine phosphosulfate reductase
MNLDAKVKLSELRIQKALREHTPERCAVACSFGKDSMVVLYLVRQQCPDILVEFTNTGVEFPQTLKQRDRVVKEWNLNFVEARSKDHNFWEIVDKYGFPGFRYDGHHGSKDIKCCRYLKEEPAWKVFRERGIKCIFTGITSAESRNRWMLERRCGDYYYAKSQGFWKAHVIMDWTKEDVWEFTRAHDIPINPFYLEYPEQRVGCMPCTGFINWDVKMAKAFPKMYRLVQKKRGQALIDDLGFFGMDVNETP